MVSLVCLVFAILATRACGFLAELASEITFVGSVFSGKYKLLSMIAALGMPEEFRGYTRVGSDPLGAGSFGETWLARDISTNKEVILKLFYSMQNGAQIYLNPNNAPSLGAQAVESLQDARTECQIPEDIISNISANPNYVPHCFVDGVDDNESSFLVLEKAGSATLKGFIEDFRNSNPSQADEVRVYTSVARMLLQGLSQFEGHYVHRDIKLENIMVSVTDEGDPTDLKIIDWGLAVPEGFVGPVAGNREHLPPETVTNLNTVWGLTVQDFVFTYQYDVYAAGETLYSIVCNKVFKTMRRLIFDKKTTWSKRNRNFKAFLDATPGRSPGCAGILPELLPLLDVIVQATKTGNRTRASELVTRFASVLA